MLAFTIEVTAALHRTYCFRLRKS